MHHSLALAARSRAARQVVSAADKIGAAPVERRISPNDLVATLYHVLGIDPLQDYHDRQGRTFKMRDESEMIRELVL